MTDEEVIQEAKSRVEGKWEYHTPPSFLIIIKRLIVMAEKYLEQKGKE